MKSLTQRFHATHLRRATRDTHDIVADYAAGDIDDADAAKDWFDFETRLMTAMTHCWRSRCCSKKTNNISQARTTPQHV